MRRAALILALSLLAVRAGAGCAPNLVDVRSPKGIAEFRVEVALTPDDRERGLMFRTSLPPRAGMLFVFDEPGSPAFWMKNTLIPLDMVFIDATGRVTQVHENAVPGDLTPIPGGPGVLAVLELNAGAVRRYGIAPGTVLRHPAFSGGPAAWPCTP